MKIFPKARYSAKQIAEYLSFRIGKGISSTYSATLVREAARFDTSSIGRYSVVGRFVLWMGDMCVQRYGHHSSLRPNFGQWLDQNNHRRPRINEITETTALVKTTIKIKKKSTSSFTAETEEMIKATIKREVKRAFDELTLPKKKRKQIPYNNIISLARKNITEMINRMAHEKQFDHKKLRHECNSRFFAMIGGPDGDYRNINSLNGPNSVIEYIEQKGCIAEYWAVLPEILSNIEKEWTLSAQQELGL